MSYRLAATIFKEQCFSNCITEKDSSLDEKKERIYNFIHVPFQLEQVRSFGPVSVCLFLIFLVNFVWFFHMHEYFLVSFYSFSFKNIVHCLLSYMEMDSSVSFETV